MPLRVAVLGRALGAAPGTRVRRVHPWRFVSIEAPLNTPPTMDDRTLHTATTVDSEHRVVHDRLRMGGDLFVGHECTNIRPSGVGVNAAPAFNIMCCDRIVHTSR